MKVTKELINSNSFDTISDILLNKTSLVVKNTTFRLCEIEFYLKNTEHNDQYVHCSEDQLKYEGFYFHKFKNGSYKSGTYKGLDTTFGDTTTKTYFGILIRSMLNVQTNEFIEGPCKCVNKILELFGYNDVKTLFEKEKFTEQFNIYNSSQGIYLIEHEHDTEQVYKGKRIGLSDKYPDFLNKNYRHAILVDNLKKKIRVVI